jgi:signal transduction histidine kinase
MGGKTMTLLETILLIVTVISVIIAVVSITLYRKRKKDITLLSQRVDTYIEKGHITDFSTKDNCFAPLQNSISDLENLLELEKHNTEREIKKNTEFISDISHQLKTPLAGLRLYCEMEYVTNPTDHTEKELQLVEKMESLISQLLRLEKIESDTYEMNFQLYDINQIVDELIDDFKVIFKNKNYDVVGGGKLRCDKTWLIEALGNLIKNASEHTADDGRISISIEDSDKSTIITVSDNGGGVPEEELPMLFTRFHRTENALPSSAGIGLAITKAIVEKHHGTISAENKDNGLSVIMCFPHIDGYITI